MRGRARSCESRQRARAVSSRHGHPPAAASWRADTPALAPAHGRRERQDAERRQRYL